MSYTTDLIKSRKSGGSTSQTRSSGVSSGGSYTQKLIQSRRKGSQDFQRTATQRNVSQPSTFSGDSFISTPEKQTFASKTKDLFGKAGSFIKKTSSSVFGSSEEILSKTQNQLINKIAERKSSGGRTKNLENSLALVTKAKDPNTPIGKKIAIETYVRLARQGSQVKSSFGNFVASALDYSTKLTEEQAKAGLDKVTKAYEKNPNNPYAKLQYEDYKKYAGGDIGTRDASNKIKKWADDVAVDAPTFGEKITQGVGSMASFAIISYATKGDATIPYLLESAGEAGSAYEELRKQGKSVREAGDKSNLVLLGNLVLNKFLNIFDDIGGAKTAKAVIVNIGKEGGQEASQQIISNLATGRPWDEGTFESGLIGGLLGGGTTMIFPSTDVKGVPADPDIMLNKVLGSELSKTKEGQELIKKSIEAQESGQELLVNEKDGKIEVGVGKYVEPVKTETTTQETLVEPTIKEEAKKYKSADELVDSQTYEKKGFKLISPNGYKNYTNYQNDVESINKGLNQYQKEDLSYVIYDEFEAKTGEKKQTLPEIVEQYDKAKLDNKETFYHGTDAKFDKFDPSLSGTQSKTGAEKGHIFLTNKVEVAESYGKNIKEYKTDIKNPLIVDAKEGTWDSIDFNNEKININDLARRAESEGYDALLVKNLRDTGGKQKGDLPAGFTSSETLVVFNQDKLKSKKAQKETDVKETKPKTTPTTGEKKVTTTKGTTKKSKAPKAEIKASKVAVSIEQNLKTKFDDLAGYESINIKDQIKRATKLVTTDLDLTREILAGTKPLPGGLRAGALIKAVEEYSTLTGDIDLARQLAISPLISETSVHAQELRLLAERDQNSVYSRIQELANERASIVEKKYKKKADKLIKEEVKKIKKKVKKIDKYDWNNFVKSIEC